MKAVIFLSGLAGLVIFGPPILRSRTHHHDISVIVHEVEKHQAVATGQENCRYEAERTFSAPAGSLDLLDLRAGSGLLEVVGVEGMSEVQVVGRACASHEEFLEDLQITGDAEGSTLVMETHHPDWSGWSGGNRYARLDLWVEVPAGMAAEIQDGSGEISLTNLGSTAVKDGSGELVAHQIHGDLTIQDGSGEIEIQEVMGSVMVEDGSGQITLLMVGMDAEIHDSSGEIEIEGVGGSLVLHDSSGDVAVRGVEGTVRIVNDSSGSIKVEGVGGDFIVERDGSGSIQYEGVAGKVDIPKKKGR